jgi:uncharacterized repeat protein (TIGR03803 family)
MLNCFNGTTGTLPLGSLLNAQDGYLYGTTYYGGSMLLGTLYRCDYSGKISILTNFNDSNGANPTSSLAIASDGNIYGTTTSGGNTSAKAGVVFRYNTTSNVYTAIYQFSGSGPQMAEGGVIEMTQGRKVDAMAAVEKAQKTISKKTIHGKTGMTE